MYTLSGKNPNKRNRVLRSILCLIFFHGCAIHMFRVNLFRIAADLLDLQFGGKRTFCSAAERPGNGTLTLPATNSAAHARTSRPTVSLCDIESLCWVKGLHLIFMQRMLYAGKSAEEQGLSFEANLRVYPISKNMHTYFLYIFIYRLYMCYL